ncbi:MAG: helix-hairpin-helix domain-containing protein, partial [Actinobacteria bacterium]|nr:helix-hairpin-helix domain-containing protein [Actinomycetota bacterium]
YIMNMEGNLNIKEKFNRLRFFFERINYSRQKNLYMTLFLIILITAAASFSIFLYQKRQADIRENMLSVYYEELSMQKNSNYADNTNEVEKETVAGGHAGIKSVDTTALIKVYVCGSIKNPGVYEIEDGARIADLLELCGGADENAALEAVNLAFILEDASMVYIPSIKEVEDKAVSFYDADAVYFGNINDSASAGGSSKIAGSVNINTAGIEELMSLPGIGEKTAGNIIEYRNSFGYFKKPEELKNVKGIGEKKFEAVKDMISV